MLSERLTVICERDACQKFDQVDFFSMVFNTYNQLDLHSMRGVTVSHDLGKSSSSMLSHHRDCYRLY